MSDYVDNFDWGMQFDQDQDQVDWSQLYEEVMSGPYGPLWEEGEAQLEPGDW